ncbi:MAG: chromosomal replication initiator protein DnaA [Clostridia bacterium]|nr:chromosomal replication initiator protein DnaA [Clostridia bacterium]
MNQDKVHWEEVLELVRPKISTAGFKTFFGNVSLLYIKNNTIYLKSANEIFSDMYEIYQEDINTAVTAVFKRPMVIKILVEEEITEDIQQEVAKNEEKTNNEYNLNPKFTFENYVVGKNNEFAYAVAYSLTQKKEVKDNYNPFLIYGGSGLGKTHLLHAIGNEIIRKYPEKKIMYITSENFVNTFIKAIGNDLPAFRDKFRKIDVLLLDDIQFFAGKEGMQEEFFNTFNDLVGERKQIVFTSDRPPKDINPLEERIKTRIASGIMIDIQPPDYETRLAIIHSKLEINNFEGKISEEIFEIVARQIKSNIRELEGAIRTIIAYSDISQKDIDIDTANRLLKDYFVESQKRKIDADYIIREVEKHFNLKNETIISQKRDKISASARQVAMYICRELTQLSLPEIGKEFGGRNHTTVLHNINKIKEEMEGDLTVMNNINELIKNISNDE